MHVLPTTRYFSITEIHVEFSSASLPLSMVRCHKPNWWSCRKPTVVNNVRQSMQSFNRELKNILVWTIPFSCRLCTDVTPNIKFILCHTLVSWTRVEVNLRLKLLWDALTFWLVSSLPTLQSVAGSRFPRRHEQQQMGATVPLIRYLLLI
jgi:hypothetical protein